MSSASGKIVYNILSNDAGVTALVSTRIQPGRANQKDPMPAIVYNIISVNPTDHKDSASAKDVARVQVFSYDVKALSAFDLAEAVRDAMDRKAPGSYGGETLVELRFEDMDSDYDESTNVHYVRQEYLVTYTR